MLGKPAVRVGKQAVPVNHRFALSLDDRWKIERRTNYSQQARNTTGMVEKRFATLVWNMLKYVERDYHIEARIRQGQLSSVTNDDVSLPLHLQ